MNKVQVLEERIKTALARSKRVRSDLTVIAVTKGHTIEEILPLYEAGIRDFGENRVVEALEKKEGLPPDIRWHLIGTLQTNKVQKVIPHFSMIHSVDSLNLARRINQISDERHVKTSILLQVNTSEELTKHGFTEEGLIQEFEALLDLPNLTILGFMTMAARFPKDDKEGEEWARICFRRLRKLKEYVTILYPSIKTHCTHLSMGMSQDFEIAIEEGATLLRIGSLLF